MELNVFKRELASALMQRGIPKEMALLQVEKISHKFTFDDLAEIKSIHSPDEIEILADGIVNILNKKSKLHPSDSSAVETYNFTKEMDVSYCTNCGQEIMDGAKFCPECGSPVQQRDIPIPYVEDVISKRETVYEGKIYKCPNCGEVLDSFARNCPACGMEIRDARVNRDILDFVNQLNAVDQEYNASSGLRKSFKKKADEEKKINIIRNYPVPNTAEAMLEFMVLATSNIDITAYDDNSAGKPLADAWLSKIEQIYKKAQLTDGSGETKQKITDLYNECTTKINKEKRTTKRKSIMIPIAIFGGLIALNILLWSVIALIENAEQKRWINSQVTNLNSLSSEIEQDISNQEYIEAAIKLNELKYKSMDDNPTTDEVDLIAEWSGIRTGLIRKIEMSADDSSLTIKPPLDPSQALGQDGDELRRTFESYGFVNVTVLIKSDLLSDSLELDGTVTQLLINGTNDFTRSSTFAFTDPVSITAHGIQYVRTPDSSENLKGKDAENVKEKFISAGFLNVEGVNLELPKNFFSVMNGKVIEISINGESDFTSSKKYVADAKVVIRYK